MPLLKGKSKHAFEHNLKTEMEHGKPEPQALAIAYSVKRKAQHKAHGGAMCAHGGPVHCNEGCYAEGGEAKMVDRVMKKHYSEGGMIANDDEPKADSLPNEFDDLHLRDDLEEHYTAENSGDELGCEDEDERRRKIIERIMMNKKMKPGHNPRPA